MTTRNQTFAVLFALLSPLWAGSIATAQDAATDAPGLNEHEQAFVDLLTGSTLVGQFTVDGRDNGDAMAERYGINRVVKVSDDDWIIEARITYGDTDIPVPVPVKVHWAGDTPVLSVTDLEIPLVGGGFTSRVIFYDGRYAGTWQHNRVGGHMFGIIEHDDESESTEE